VIPLWVAITAGPALWALHLVGAGAVVEYACNTGGSEWPMHALTIATALPTVAALLYCVRVARVDPPDEPEGAGTLAGRTRFLAVFGALTVAISLALIVLEGSYVLFISPCA
jgi:hypothetical protein